MQQRAGSGIRPRPIIPELRVILRYVDVLGREMSGFFCRSGDFSFCCVLLDEMVGKTPNGLLGGCRVGLGCGQNAAQGMLAPPSGFDPQLKPGVRLPSSFLGQDVPAFLPSSIFASCPKHKALGEQYVGFLTICGGPLKQQISGSSLGKVGEILRFSSSTIDQRLGGWEGRALAVYREKRRECSILSAPQASRIYIATKRKQQKKNAVCGLRLTGSSGRIHSTFVRPRGWACFCTCSSSACRSRQVLKTALLGGPLSRLYPRLVLFSTRIGCSWFGRSLSFRGYIQLG
ncbi:hypothetical protein F5144DRAFT_260809 [Chaetomium tenue]|uniref:Uncharacterized protein n=1 Tax=Chaetomium tenue TaxID=1854479 RepID=A0ACB7PBA2_9PEZI|nr:hypothetical protein F5144DRAFT_260809 [Chaetomium globosum]